ncbi:hypothetical protein Y1Q_0005621 [Alligator mississippiensis]|uniref:Uncharacterized protein n=1 Tax=Alligator mississippiensis TaxID=8496 RepID=A0A151MF83_ALLMI|nr:hypothetical protein Y1Q_0005621 [Alligator mississippiensis]
MLPITDSTRNVNAEWICLTLGNLTENTDCIRGLQGMKNGLSCPFAAFPPPVKTGRWKGTGANPSECSAFSCESHWCEKEQLLST